MWAHYLTPQDYQDLIDRGWRRSGKYCYKPMLRETCCPQYTIRCLANDFKPSKSHKKVLKKFRNFILNDAGAEKKTSLRIDEKQVKPEYQDPLFSSDDDDENCDDEFQSEAANLAEEKVAFDGTRVAVDSATANSVTVGSAKTSVSTTSVSSSTTTNSKEQTDAASISSPAKKPKPGAGPDPNKPKPRKAKEIRREMAKLKGKPDKKAEAKKNNEETSLEELTEFFLKAGESDIGSPKHTFQLRMVRATHEDQEFSRTHDESFKIYQKYQVMIHKDKPAECTANQFKRFLCASPILEGVPPKHNNPSKTNLYPQDYFPSSYGGYHQQYILDGKIICVAVLDILPDCVSSVYLYYDPDYSFLSLGTLSALFEIAYIRQINKNWSERINLYYMGFYIHSCPKMRYKSQYSPSKLLCPETFGWVDVDKCRPLLDKSKYSRLDPNTSTSDQLAIDWCQPWASALLDAVLILHRHRAMPYNIYKGLPHRKEADSEFLQDDDGEIKEYLTLVGEKVSKRMLLYREVR